MTFPMELKSTRLGKTIVYGGQQSSQTLVQRKKRVQDETGFVQTISLSKKSDLKRIAKLGTHTRDARANPGERKEPKTVVTKTRRKYRDNQRGNKFTFPKSLLTGGKILMS